MDSTVPEAYSRLKSGLVRKLKEMDKLSAERVKAQELTELSQNPVNFCLRGDDTAG